MLAGDGGEGLVVKEPQKVFPSARQSPRRGNYKCFNPIKYGLNCRGATVAQLLQKVISPITAGRWFSQLPLASANYGRIVWNTSSVVINLFKKLNRENTEMVFSLMLTMKYGCKK